MRTRHFRHKAQSAALALAVATGVAACGSSDGDKQAVGAAGGTGFITNLQGGSATISFPADAKAGDQYILMPYALGDINTVQGGVDTTTFDFTIKTATTKGGSLYMVDPKLTALALASQEDDEVTKARKLDRDLRHLLNRFSRRDGAKQGEGLWSLAKSIDSRTQLNLTDQFERAALSYQAKKTALSLTAADENCPTTKLTVPGPDGDPEEITLPEGSVESGQGYCLIVVGNLVTEPSKDALKATIESLLKTYKEVIYKDSFASTDKFVFRPVFAFIDFANADVWPFGKALAGAYSRDVSQDFGKPILFMPLDLKASDEFKSVSDTALLRRTLHGTIGHELQHAVSDYLRTIKTPGGAQETRTIDEGIAQFTEDLNGFGEDNFAGMSKAFLDVFGSGALRFLEGQDNEDNNTTRGGTHAFLYYLASQKGGVEFTSGLPSGGGGLAFLKDIVGSTKSGPANLADKFGGNWTDVVGNYLGALVLDNTTATPAATSLYQVQEPVSSVTNLIGETGKTFGMRFNRYKDIADHSGDYFKYNAENKADISGVSHYQTKPVLFEIKTPGEQLTVTISSAEIPNAAVSIVRIK